MTRSAAKVMVRIFLLTAMVGVALLFMSGSMASGGQGVAPDGPRFVVNCTQTGPAPQGGGLGALTCTLKVTGLPDPLGREVVVTQFVTNDAPDGPDDWSPVSTTVSFGAPDTTPGEPVLVTRSLPVNPPPPPPVVPRVPEEPPKYL